MPEPPPSTDLQNSSRSAAVGRGRSVVDALSGLLAIALLVMCGYSLFYSTSVTVVSRRQLGQVTVERGMLGVLHLQPWNNLPPRFPIVTSDVWAPFSRMAPWRWAWASSANSWWEGVGYQTDRRWRLFGFEYATGIFWPPFVTQHPKVPFTVLSVPLWLLVPIFALLPARTLLSRRSRMLDVPMA